MTIVDVRQKCITCTSFGLGGSFYPCTSCIHANHEDHYVEAHICSNCKESRYTDDDRYACRVKNGKVVKPHGTCKKWGKIETEEEFFK